jgi:hypothetical protein
VNRPDVDVCIGSDQHEVTLRLIHDDRIPWFEEMAEVSGGALEFISPGLVD